jgi:calcium permeable stress-gated cation channel
VRHDPNLPTGCISSDVYTFSAHRFLIGYVYGRTRSQTGGLLQIWLIKRFGTLLAFQPLVLGLIFLSRRLWIEGGVLCGTAAFVVVFVEAYCWWRTRLPGRKSLSNVTKDSLDTFYKAAKPKGLREIDEESTSLVSSSRATRMRGSFASILDMMSMTLAVMPSPSQTRGPVPLGKINTP